MKQKNRKVNFETLAQSMLRLPVDQIGVDKHDLARQYIRIIRRGRILKRGIPEAQRYARLSNPLHEIRFRPPLSVAGVTDSAVIVRAENLAQLGVPIAMEFDARGKHRGVPLDEVVTAMEAETGQEWGPIGIMDLYRQLMSGHPALIETNTEPRYRKIPRLINRNAVRRAHIERQLTDAFQAEASPQSTPIFTVLVARDVLAAALAGATRPVVLGFGKAGLRFSGITLPHVWGSGSGGAVLARRDLRAFLRCTTLPLLGIQCRLDQWLGWEADQTNARSMANATGGSVAARYYRRARLPDG